MGGGGSAGLYRLVSMDARFTSEEDEGGVQIVFDVDPAATGLEHRARSPILASYLLSHNLEISIWAQNASNIFAVGVATLPLFVLLRQQRESVLFQGSLPIRQPSGSAAKGRSSLPATDREDNLLHLRAANVGSRGAPTHPRRPTSPPRLSWCTPHRAGHIATHRWTRDGLRDLTHREPGVDLETWNG